MSDIAWTALFVGTVALLMYTGRLRYEHGIWDGAFNQFLPRVQKAMRSYDEHRAAKILDGPDPAEVERQRLGELLWQRTLTEKGERRIAFMQATGAVRRGRFPTAQEMLENLQRFIDEEVEDDEESSS